MGTIIASVTPKLNARGNRAVRGQAASPDERDGHLMADRDTKAFTCPYCVTDLVIRVSDLADGHRVTCPRCGKHSEVRKTPTLGQDGYGFTGKAWYLRPLD